MAVLLLLETAAEICSVALCDNNQIVAIKKSDEPRAHASVLAVFIDTILKENNLAVKDLDAVAVSKGPGSYTGLRIGVATAKGLCYTAQKPLISVDTLLSMAMEYASLHEIDADALIIPMLDARRDEVYSAVYAMNGDVVSDVEAKILDAHSFADLQGKKVYVVGDGAEKAATLMGKRNGFTYDGAFRHSAVGMVQQAYDKFMTKDFEDVAYFEPFYLKEFAGVVPKSRNV